MKKLQVLWRLKRLGKFTKPKVICSNIFCTSFRSTYVRLEKANQKILPVTKIQELLIIVLCRFACWLIHFMDSSPVSYSLSSSNSYVSSRSTALSPPSSQHSLLHNSTGLDDNNGNNEDDDDTVTNITLIQAELWQQQLQCPPPSPQPKPLPMLGLCGVPQSYHHSPPCPLAADMQHIDLKTIPESWWLWCILSTWDEYL